MQEKERDREVHKQLASMGRHCITIWKCKQKPVEREETLDAIAFTLNHIWLQDHSIKGVNNVENPNKIDDEYGLNDK